MWRYWEPFSPVFLSAATQIALHRLPEGGAMNVWSNEKYCDLANLILGAVLIVSPWMFGFAAGAPSQNAWITGIAIAILSIAALAAFAEWEEWLNLVAGLWAIVSPWVLGFQGTTAMTVHVVIGVVVAALAAAELWMRYHPPRLTAGS
jgi:SPW repeat-containing protein